MAILLYIILFTTLGCLARYFIRIPALAYSIFIVVSLLWAIPFGPFAFATLAELCIGYNLINTDLASKSDIERFKTNCIKILKTLSFIAVISLVLFVLYTIFSNGNRTQHTQKEGTSPLMATVDNKYSHPEQSSIRDYTSYNQYYNTPQNILRRKVFVGTITHICKNSY